MLDRGGDDLDAPRRVAVQAAELLLFLHTTDADGIGAADDLVLGLGSPLGFEVATFGLHLGQRVEGADERHLAQVLQPVRRLTAEPVVGVGHIGWERPVEVVVHPGDEVVDDVR